MGHFNGRVAIVKLLRNRPGAVSPSAGGSHEEAHRSFVSYPELVVDANDNGRLLRPATSPNRHAGDEHRPAQCHRPLVASQPLPPGRFWIKFGKGFPGVTR
jgi:hypothetical protein